MLPHRRGPSPEGSWPKSGGVTRKPRRREPNLSSSDGSGRPTRTLKVGVLARNAGAGTTSLLTAGGPGPPRPRNTPRSRPPPPQNAPQCLRHLSGHLAPEAGRLQDVGLVDDRDLLAAQPAMGGMGAAWRHTTVLDHQSPGRVACSIPVAQDAARDPLKQRSCRQHAFPTASETVMSATRKRQTSKRLLPSRCRTKPRVAWLDNLRA